MSRQLTAVLILVCLPGCSFFIRDSAPRYTNLGTRKIVHETFGPPDSITSVDLVNPSSQQVQQFQVEHHHVRKRFNTFAAPGFMLPGLMLLMEPYHTAEALYEIGKDYTRGHHIKFVYDDDGTTIGYRIPMADWGGYSPNGHTGRNVLRWNLATDEQEFAALVDDITQATPSPTGSDAPPAALTNGAETESPDGITQASASTAASTTESTAQSPPTP